MASGLNVEILQFLNSTAVSMFPELQDPTKFNERRFHIIMTLFHKPPGLKKVYLKESSVHGLGVFAQKDLKAGELITIYPPHYVLYYPQGKEADQNNIEAYLNDTFSQAKITPELYDIYSFNVNSYYSFYGDPEIRDPDFLGHMINDGVKSTDPVEYNKLFLIKNNATPVDVGKFGLTLAIMAIKDIKKDEEILIPYGVEYWKNIDLGVKSKIIPIK